MIIGNVVHGAAINCMIVNYAEPDAWFFKQFVSQSQLEDFAIEHNLIMRREPDGTDGTQC